MKLLSLIAILVFIFYLATGIHASHKIASFLNCMSECRPKEACWGTCWKDEGSLDWIFEKRTTDVTKIKEMCPSFMTQAELYGYECRLR